MVEDERATGGCLCGQVRFEAAGRPLDTGYCHCRMCQRSSGAPAQPWASFVAAALRWSGVEPTAYASSPGARRLFCGACGSQLGFDDSSEVSLNTGCFDRPERFPPKRHIWCESRLPWFDTTDDLPRFQRDG